MTADMLGAGPGAAGMMGQHTGGGVGFGGDGGNAFALVLGNHIHKKKIQKEEKRIQGRYTKVT